MAPRSPRRDAGLTLIELAITMLISVMLLGLLASVLVLGSRIEEWTSQDAASVSSLRVAMSRFTKEARQASDVECVRETEVWLRPPPSAAAAVSWRIDAAPSGEARLVRSVVQTGDADCSSGGPDEVVVEGIVARAGFTYFDHDPDAGVVSLTLLAPAGDVRRGETQLGTHVALRNRKP